MPASKIKCGGCGTEGEFEIEGLDSNVIPDMLFRYLGHHEFTGNMYFLCPHCRREVVVNPMEILEAPEADKRKGISASVCVDRNNPHATRLTQISRIQIKIRKEALKMFAPKTILVATDFSEFSDRAVKDAVEMAENLQGETNHAPCNRRKPPAMRRRLLPERGGVY